jgi:hypothetical protein
MSSSRKLIVIALVLVVLSAYPAAMAYPPAVGILGKSQNCLVCHQDNGSWKEGPELVIDIRDKATQASLRQVDGTFLLSVQRGETATVMTVIGYRTADSQLIPYRNAWLYIDPETIGGSALSKFLPGWNINLPMACRVVGDKLKDYSDVHGTALPMTVRPTDAARNGEVTLQVMLTKGESVKGKPQEGIVGNYFERTLRLEVED